ncbi:MAG: class I SAM-dependent methyltransferase [Candidatus Levybacteria bacterium]|nr:class I SAM-dependent methyltransferase [Candidatus Levybacteria bacterium]
MIDYSKVNKKWWNEVTSIHAKSALYNLNNFKKGKTSLESIEKEELGVVKGKSLLHLMCHFGMDTLSWAREGAIATGVDLSDHSIMLAQQLSREIKVPADFICSDIYNLPQVLDKKFDIVFTSYGVLCWVKDIKKWARLISHFLKDGGTFYIVELHPFCNILSHDLKLYYKYFDKGPYIDDSTGTYADWDADVKGLTYEWSYTMGDVINSLIGVGLTIEYVHEFPFSTYDQFPGFMEINKKGQYVLKNKKIQLPLLFSLKAIKPA